MSRALKILIDMDCVLCDFELHFLRMFQLTYPNDPYIPLEHRRTFYLGDQYKQLDGTNMREKVASIYNTRDFFLNLPPINGALDGVKKIAGLKKNSLSVDAFICTSPVSGSKYCAAEKYEWVRRHLGAEWTKRMILTGDKTMILGDLLIDDKPNIQGVNCAKKPWIQVLFSAYHNRHIDLSQIDAQYRLDGWNEMQKLLEIIKNTSSSVS